MRLINLIIEAVCKQARAVFPEFYTALATEFPEFRCIQTRMQTLALIQRVIVKPAVREDLWEKAYGHLEVKDLVYQRDSFFVVQLMLWGPLAFSHEMQGEIDRFFEHPLTLAGVALFYAARLRLAYNACNGIPSGIEASDLHLGRCEIVANSIVADGLNTLLEEDEGQFISYINERLRYRDTFSYREFDFDFRIRGELINYYRYYRKNEYFPDYGISFRRIKDVDVPEGHAALLWYKTINPT